MPVSLDVPDRGVIATRTRGGPPDDGSAVLGDRHARAGCARARDRPPPPCGARDGVERRQERRRQQVGVRLAPRLHVHAGDARRVRVDGWSDGDRLCVPHAPTVPGAPAQTHPRVTRVRHARCPGRVTEEAGEVSLT